MSDTPQTDEHEANLIGCCHPLTHFGSMADFSRQLERELAASQAGQAELLERLEERTQSHLLASARDVQTIQRQAVELAKWQALAEGLANSLTFWDVNNSALAAYEAAKSANHD
jgi:hypothetical protein